MPTEQILALLVAERDRLNQAIEALQGPVKRRGRPPKNARVTSTPGARKSRKGISAAARQAQSKRMKAYWAKLKKQTKS